MSDLALRVEGLGKRYRVGRIVDPTAPGRSALVRRLLSPFHYLLATLREPDEAELIWALRSVSFEIGHGEVVGIIGQNGAGKSTLLKLLSRITEPTEGRALIYGRVGSLLEVGTGFHPDLTGRENVYLNGAILGMRRSEIDSKFDEIVAFAGVERFIDTQVKRYSSGMYVRLAFAVAAHLEPEILIVDEVLAVGDVAFQNKCLGKMSDVAAEGRTVLFVSHNMTAVQRLCQRVLFLRNGTVVSDATTDEGVAVYLDSLEKSSAESLAVRSDRNGRGQIRLQRIVLSAGDDESAPIRTGGPVRLTFELSGMMPGLFCNFTVYDRYGQAVTHFASGHVAPADHAANHGARFVCEIDELLLVPGRYRLNAAVRGDGVLQDRVEGALLFDVQTGAVRGRAVHAGTQFGGIAMPHRWTTPVT
jgi:lipopolysaccharide transport system ATP-binding protein